MTRRREKPFQHPTGGKPKTVLLLGHGPSKIDYIREMSSAEGGYDVDEIWLVNMGLRAFQGDLCFAMDDMAVYAETYPKYGEAMQRWKQPIITCRAYPHIPATVQYPLEDVLRFIPHTKPFFNTTPAYAVPYAAMIGVKKLILSGCDYRPMAGHPAIEEGAECLTFWLGVCLSLGMEFEITPSSTLMGTCSGPQWYGYLVPPNPKITRAGDGG